MPTELVCFCCFFYLFFVAVQHDSQTDPAFFFHNNNKKNNFKALQNSYRPVVMPILNSYLNSRPIFNIFIPCNLLVSGASYLLQFEMVIFICN